MLPLGQSVMLPNQCRHVWQSPWVCQSVCSSLTGLVISALWQSLPWTAWTAVTGEEVRITQHENPAHTNWLVLFPPLTIIGSGKVLQFVFSDQKKKNSPSALSEFPSEPANVFYQVTQVYMFTWAEKKICLVCNKSRSAGKYFLAHKCACLLQAHLCKLTQNHKVPMKGGLRSEEA